MKKVIYLILFTLVILHSGIQAQTIGEIEDISYPLLNSLFDLNAKDGNSGCTGGCLDADDFSYSCGFLLGCQVGYEDGQSDANQCFREFDFVLVFGPQNFQNGYRDGWYESYERGYRDRLIEKTLQCTARSNQEMTYQFDDFTCECTCIKKQYLFDGDNDGYYDNEKVFRYECSPPSSNWKLASAFFGVDCNDNDSNVNSYNECGICTIGDITTWYYDGDGDGYYGETIVNCNRPATGVESKWSTNSGRGQDCDDNDLDANIEKTWYYFGDDDNYYGQTITSCKRPNSFNPTKWLITPKNGEDCDDYNSSIFGISTWYFDGDGDGYHLTSISSCLRPTVDDPNKWLLETLGKDCNDSDPSLFRRDGCGNCVGDNSNLRTVYIDYDGDGYHSVEITLEDPEDAVCAELVSYLFLENIVDENLSLLLDRIQNGVRTDFSSSREAMGTFQEIASIGNGMYRARNRDQCTFCLDPIIHGYFEQADGRRFSFQKTGNEIRFIFLAYQDIINNQQGNLLISETLGVDCDDFNPNQLSNGQWYFDGDGDGYHNGDIAPTNFTCTPPNNQYLLLANSKGVDCDDNDINATELITWYFDNDLDHFISNTTQQSCENPAKDTEDENKWRKDTGNGEDCDDNDPESNNADRIWYFDNDGDNFYSISQVSCHNPGYGTSSEDKWKADPGLGEDCDDQDSTKQTANACGECGGTDEPIDFYLDMDGDGYHSLQKKQIAV